MAVAVVGTPPNVVTTTGTSQFVDLPSVTAGNLIVVCVIGATAGITWTCSDDKGNTYVSAVSRDTTVDGEIFYAKNVASGTTRVTVSGSGSSTYEIGALEVSGCSTTSPYDVSATFVDGAVSNDHYCADASGLTIAANAIVVSVGLLAGSATATVAGSSPTAYTSFPLGTGAMRYCFQYHITSGGLSGERAHWTSTGTARVGYSLMASFKAGAGVSTRRTSACLVG